MEKICVEKIEGASAELMSNKDYATFLTSKIWPQGVTLGIYFMNSPEDGNVTISRCSGNDCKNIDPLQDKYQKQSDDGTLDIKEAIKEIVNDRYVPLLDRLTLTFVDDIEDSTIRIKFDQNAGSWSHIGNDAQNVPIDQPTMNLGWFNVRTVLHEFGHVLGLGHEHQNPRGKQIDWNIPVLDAYMQRTQGWNPQQVYDQIIKKYRKDQTNGSTFDKDSIMAYFYPPNLTNNNQGIKQNSKLSSTDVEFIKKIYSRDQTSISDPPSRYQPRYHPSEVWMLIFIFAVVSITLLTIAIVKHRNR